MRIDVEPGRIDADQRQRCLADAARRHDEYERGVKAAREAR